MVGMLFFVIAFLFYLFPPKRINALYGYRTARSMKNDKVWQAANRKSASLFLYLAIVLLLMGILDYFIKELVLLPIQIGVLLGGLGWMIWRTEAYLNVHFDKNGNEKG